MNEDKLEFEELETICTEVISAVLLACEAKFAKNNDDVKGLSSAVMSVSGYGEW